VSPILGIYASQISGHLFAPSGAYDSIATGVGTGSSGTITFSSIPQTYTHLQLRISTVNSQYGTVSFNGDTTSTNYRSHALVGTGLAASSVTYTNVIYMPWDSADSNNPYSEVIDILDYQNTSKNKTIRGLSGQDGNASGTATNWRIQLSSGAWYNSSAVTSITIFVPTWTLGQYSSFALYGIKG